MKIVQIANYVHLESGGLGQAMNALRTQYRNMGHDVIEVVPKFGIFDFDYSHSARRVVDSIPLPFSGGYRVIIKRREVSRLIEDFQPDVVELHDVTTLGWLAKWCTDRGIRVITYSHERTDLTIKRLGVSRFLVSTFVDRMRIKIEKHSTIIVCASDFAANEFRNPDSKICVIPLGVENEVFEVNRRFDDWRSPLRVVICSRLSSEKGVQSAVDGFIELSKVMPAHLRVLGDGPLRQSLEHQLSGLSFEFLGHVQDRMTVATELAYADVVLSMGPVETFGLTTLEALSSGTPVVVANSGASTEIVDNRVGRISNCDGISIANAILDLMGTPRQELSENAFLRSQTYSWGKTAQDILQSAAVASESFDNATH